MHSISRFNPGKLLKTVAFNLIFVIIFIYGVPVHSQDSSQQLLKDGIKLYEEGKLDQAIAKLTSCVERGDLTKEQMTQVYKYLAQAYMAKEFRDQAKGAVEKLLNIMPNYKPHPMLDRPQFIDLVETVKQEQKLKKEEAKKDLNVREIPPETARQKSNIKKWLLLGGGVVVAGVVTVAMLGSTEQKQEKGSIKISW